MYEDEKLTLARIASMFYEEGLTQEEIGNKVGLSRMQVHRRLKAAEDLGIVEIVINYPSGAFLELEHRLRDTFNLKDVVIVSSANTYKKNRANIGEEAGKYLLDNVDEGDFIGISWGYTVREMVRSLPEKKTKNVTVGNIIGGLSALGDKGAQEMAVNMSIKLGGQPQLLNLPFQVDSNEIKEAILKDSRINKVVNNLKETDLIFIGIGSIDQSEIQDLFYEHGIRDEQFTRKLKEQQAVGEMIGRYYDIKGNIIEDGRNINIIGLDLQDLQNAKRVVGIAGGEHKVKAIIGAARGRFINTLITDEKTANKMLDFI